MSKRDIFAQMVAAYGLMPFMDAFARRPGVATTATLRAARKAKARRRKASAASRRRNR